MKKYKVIITLVIVLTFMCGCRKEQVELEKDEGLKEEKFVLAKIDDNKEYIYLEDYRKLVLMDNTSYNMQNLVVNIKSDNVINVNLELSSFVKKSFKNMKVLDNVMKQGNIISYDYFESEGYFSIIQKYCLYIEGNIGEEKSNVYVISKETGKFLNNEEILKIYGYENDTFYNFLKSNIKSDDIDFTMMNIKNDGYSLYINKDNNLVVVYYEINDIEEIRKEIILNDDLK